ncbi:MULTISPECIES: hypothetical protein [unclassified Pseudarthrobacter]|uniref:hypothetical protein n=1 Tax=unclassified Pseudarthrobacter TaxID=2647000 RepID=UPI003076F280
MDRVNVTELEGFRLSCKVNSRRLRLGSREMAAVEGGFLAGLAEGKHDEDPNLY